MAAIVPLRGKHDANPREIAAVERWITRKPKGVALRRISLVLLAFAFCAGSCFAQKPGELNSYTINTAAGNYQYGNGGPATQGLLAYPYKITFDSSGAAYIADTSNQMIRKIGDAAATIRSVGSRRALWGSIRLT